MSSGEGPQPNGPKRRMLLIAAATALALMALIVLTTAKSRPIVQSPDRDPDVHISLHPFTQSTTRSAPSTGPNNGMAQREGSHLLGTIFLDIVLVLVLAGLLWLLVVIGVALVRRLRTLRRKRQQPPLPEVEDAVAEAVFRSAGRQRQLLYEGTPSNAIVACWVDLERTVGAVGIERRPSETSAELTIRVLDSLDVDRAALRRLGALYRESRFSSRPVTEAERQRALDALDALHRSLRSADEERV